MSRKNSTAGIARLEAEIKHLKESQDKFLEQINEKSNRITSLERTKVFLYGALVVIFGSAGVFGTRVYGIFQDYLDLERRANEIVYIARNELDRLGANDLSEVGADPKLKTLRSDVESVALYVAALDLRDNIHDAENEWLWSEVSKERKSSRVGEYRKYFLLKELAERGDSSAMFRLGLMHEEDGNPLFDLKESFSWYKRAAAVEHSSAQNNLGVLYSKGRGVESSRKKAVYWYRKAASNGSDQAISNLISLEEEVN